MEGGCFFEGYGDQRGLDSFATRRSCELGHQNSWGRYGVWQVFYRAGESGAARLTSAGGGGVQTSGGPYGVGEVPHQKKTQKRDGLQDRKSPLFNSTHP